jgi:predicted transposase/invertase (TIGR01784 family)
MEKNIRTLKPKAISYDGILKELLDEFPSENIIELINNLFEKNYPRDSVVAKLTTESHKDGTEQRSDILFRIGSDMYHAEIQSNDDKDIAFRVFQYSYRAALQHGKTVEMDYLKLDFPKSVVFYLRTKDRTPHEITIELNLPDGNMVTFKIPAKHLKEYSIQDLTDKAMIAFAPYYPMLHEGEQLKSPQGLKNLKNDTLFIIDKIKEKADNGEIGRNAAELTIKSLEDILEYVMVKSKVDRKEVDEIMEAVARKYHLEPLNWREEGRIEGLAKGKEETAKKMLAKGYKIEDIQDITGLKAETIEKLK